MVTKKIQWFPGHMHKAGKEIAAMLGKVDVCIEILDARIPFSSANPMLASLRGQKPCLKVLSKGDLADPALNVEWQQHCEADAGTRVLLANIQKSGTVSGIPAMCRQLYDQRGGSKTIITAMVLGIPNVGKSTLINNLAGKTVAKTGNQPAITKFQQVIEIEPGFVLLDTPGLMWPNVENRYSGFRLAVTGAIRDTAISHQEVACFAADYFIHTFPERLVERYHLDRDLTGIEEIIAEIGRRRGCLVKGGKVDMDRASKVLLADIRDGRLGRYTLETPQMIEKEIIEVDLQRRQKVQRDLQRKQKWKNSKS